MPLDEVMDSMRASLQAALDELASPRSSSKSKLKALQDIERNLAMALFNKDNNSEAKDCFIALQYTFECNVPLHLLSWIIKATSRLEAVTNRGSMDVEQGSEAEELGVQFTLSLSLIQGIVLNHEASKVYLGRKPALETLLDLLLASRHLSPPQETAESKSKPTSSSPPLTSIILDTLLCILVDSSAALRAFEAAGGVQVVVRILKRAGTPREVRMKCLEFLYFYLLDESPTTPISAAVLSPADLVSDRPITKWTPPPTRPATPIRPLKPYLTSGPKHPTSRYGSSTYSLASSSSASSASLSLSASSVSSSSRSTSGSSVKSFSSTSSNASSPTPASSISSSPAKESPLAPRSAGRSPVKRHPTPSNQLQRTPPVSPPFSSAAKFPQMRSLMMLKKDVEYVPQSPKKSPGITTRPTHQKTQSLSTSTSVTPRMSSSLIYSHSRTRSQATLLGSTNESGAGSESGTLAGDGKDFSSPSKLERCDRDGEASPQKIPDYGHKQDLKWKTTEEKKELLGTMLGNVDALVEGVRKAGIWGLG